MTEQPDTAAIRAHYEINTRDAMDNPAGIIDIAVLCDALDAARAEEPRTGWTYADLSHAVDSVEYWKTRTAAAGARITAALEYCEGSDCRCDTPGGNTCDVCVISRALTGDTP